MAVWGWDDINGNKTTRDTASYGEDFQQPSASDNIRLVRRLIGAMICALFFAVLSYYSRTSMPSPYEGRHMIRFSAR